MINPVVFNRSKEVIQSKMRVDLTTQFQILNFSRIINIFPLNYPLIKGDLSEIGKAKRLAVSDFNQRFSISLDPETSPG